MIPLAVQRGGGLAWEYYFHFDGGSPPWTSAMSQGTALEALTRASRRSGRSRDRAGPAPSLSPAHTCRSPTGAGDLHRRAAVGVRVATPAGARYLQYSFAPGVDIINAFLQSLIGLYDYAQASGDAEAKRAVRRRATPRPAPSCPSSTPARGRCTSPGVEDTLSYHELVTGFLDAAVRADPRRRSTARPPSTSSRT